MLHDLRNSFLFLFRNRENLKEILWFRTHLPGPLTTTKKNQLAKTKQPFLIFHARRTRELKLKICERVRQSLFSSSKNDPIIHWSHPPTLRSCALYLTMRSILRRSNELIDSVSCCADFHHRRPSWKITWTFFKWFILLFLRFSIGTFLTHNEHFWGWNLFARFFFCESIVGGVKMLQTSIVMNCFEVLITFSRCNFIIRHFYDAEKLLWPKKYEQLLYLNSLLVPSIANYMMIRSKQQIYI